MTSRLAASAAMVSNTADALLFTTVAACAPVSSQTSSSTSASRSPRAPLSRSNSRFVGARIACATATIASSGSSARPRLVCSTVPVRLKTGFNSGVSRDSIRADSAAAIPASSTACTDLPRRRASRQSSSSARTSPVTKVRPCASNSTATAGSLSTRSTEGSSFNCIFEPRTVESSGGALIIDA